MKNYPRAPTMPSAPRMGITCFKGGEMADSADSLNHSPTRQYCLKKREWTQRPRITVEFF
jgi:hypothetical protein